MVYCDIGRHSSEGMNPENSVPSRLDARLRGHDVKNTPIPELSNLVINRINRITSRNTRIFIKTIAANVTTTRTTNRAKT